MKYDDGIKKNDIWEKHLEIWHSAKCHDNQQSNIQQNNINKWHLAKVTNIRMILMSFLKMTQDSIV